MPSKKDRFMERLSVLARDRRWSDVDEEIDRGLGLSTEELSKLLVILCEYGGKDYVSKLVQRGANPDYRLQTGETPISQTIIGSRGRNPTLGTLVALLNAGANPNEITFGGYTPVQLAIAENRPEYAALLLLGGADPFLPSVDPDRPTAFTIAERSRNGWAEDMLRRWRFEHGR